MKKMHLLFAGAFAALAIVACSDDELETETKTETETETEEGNTGDENTGDENTGEEEEAPQAYITLSEAELHFARTGGEATVTVETNYDWDCEYESDWFTVVADTGAGTLTVTCDANGTGEVREGAVMVTAGDGEENVAEATLTITQSIYEADALVLEYTITSDNTTIQLPLGEKDNDGNVFTIECTVDWGDGSEVESVKSCWPSHTYSEGTYNVIINGTVELLEDFDYDTWYDIKGVECLIAVKQWGDLGLKSMVSAFYDCTNLTSLPDGAGPFSNVTSFYWAFGWCTSLTALPENMLSNCSSATDFYSAFCVCESLTTVPEDMFSGCTAAVDFGYAFGYCTSLTTVPANLFANCPSVEYFDGVFYECTSLTSVPVGIFDNNKSVIYFSYAFYDCESLITVPEDMFSNCTDAEDFESVFESCSKLTSAPSFKGLSNVTNFYSVFYECYSLTTVPEGMFSGCTAAEDFEYAFADCTSLTTVPDNFFANCTSVESFKGVLGECYSLETVPVGIFDDSKSVTNFKLAFISCPKLVGESPYTMIGEEKVHLYERENYSEYFTAPTDYEDCFAGCTGLDDYYSIPSGWGGGASPSSVTPQSMDAPSPEGFGPSRLGLQRDAMGPRMNAARSHSTQK